MIEAFIIFVFVFAIVLLMYSVSSSVRLGSKKTLGLFAYREHEEIKIAKKR